MIEHYLFILDRERERERSTESIHFETNLLLRFSSFLHHSIKLWDWKGYSMSFSFIYHEFWSLYSTHLAAPSAFGGHYWEKMIGGHFLFCFWKALNVKDKEFCLKLKFPEQMSKAVNLSWLLGFTIFHYGHKYKSHFLHLMAGNSLPCPCLSVFTWDP